MVAAWDGVGIAVDLLARAAVVPPCDCRMQVSGRLRVHETMCQSRAVARAAARYRHRDNRSTARQVSRVLASVLRLFALVPCSCRQVPHAEWCLLLEAAETEASLYARYRVGRHYHRHTTMGLG